LFIELQKKHCKYIAILMTGWEWYTLDTILNKSTIMNYCCCQLSQNSVCFREVSHFLLQSCNQIGTNSYHRKNRFRAVVILFRILFVEFNWKSMGIFPLLEWRQHTNHIVGHANFYNFYSLHFFVIIFWLRFHLLRQ
jgi:hypothetical protein